MRRRVGLLLMIGMLLVSESGCGSPSGTPAVQNADEPQREETLVQEPKPSGEETASIQPERSDAEVRKLELTMELRWNAYEKLRDQASRMDQMGQGLSEEEIRELVQSEILRCYEENTLLAVEIKTVVMGSLGCTVPAGFSTGEDVMRDYGDYVKNTVLSKIDVQGVIDEIASPQVQAVLKNGVEGGLAAYQSSKSLEDALEGAAESITYGVAAGIQEQAETFAVNILDETTHGLFRVVQEISEYDSIEDYLVGKADQKVGGLIGTLAGIADYDTTPGALLQSVSDSANTSVAEIKSFLNQEVITSREIGKMMYEYSLFGNAMQTLFQYGGSGYFDWKPNYDKMETLYKRFLRNEVMIEMLSSKGEITNPAPVEEVLPGSNETVEYLYEKPGLTSQEEELDNQARFELLTEKLEELERAIAQLESRLEDGPNVTAALAAYRQQMEAVNAAYEGILEYSVQNFQAVYDEQGIAKVQELNSKNYAIGEIAKYTPYGIVLNLLTSSTIANSDSYYNSMQEANETFGRAYQKAALEAKDAVSALEVRTDFYRELVAEQEDIWDEYENLCLLKYMLGDKKIDVEQYGQEVKKDLYLLALQTDVMGKIYGALYADPTASNTYAAQYQELMGLVDPQGTGEIAALVSDEERSGTLLPILQAGISAIQFMEQSQNPNVDNKHVMIYRDDGTPGGKVRCSFLVYDLVHVHHDNRWIDIYYSKNDPLFINGYYVYDGIVLNGEEGMDALTACEEARWIKENIWSNTRTFQEECAVHVENIKKAWGQN